MVNVIEILCSVCFVLSEDGDWDIMIIMVWGTFVYQKLMLKRRHFAWILRLYCKMNEGSNSNTERKCSAFLQFFVCIISIAWSIRLNIFCWMYWIVCVECLYLASLAHKKGLGSELFCSKVLRAKNCHRKVDSGIRRTALCWSFHQHSNITNIKFPATRGPQMTVEN